MRRDHQAEFCAALLDRSVPVPESVISHTAARPERRYAVHRNNVLASLIEAILSRFPVALRIVGDDCLRELARRYVCLFPPRSPVLLTYGDDMPDFVARIGGELGLPYLPDVMRLEVLWSQAYHAADAMPTRREVLASLVPEELSDTRVIFHPAARLFRSAHPAVSIWQMNVEASEPHAIETWRGEDALVTRPHLVVGVHRLPAGRLAFFEALRAGASLASAAQTAISTSADFDAAAAFAELISAGVTTGFAPC